MTNVIFQTTLDNEETVEDTCHIRFTNKAARAMAVIGQKIALVIQYSEGKKNQYPKGWRKFGKIENNGLYIFAEKVMKRPVYIAK